MTNNSLPDDDGDGELGLRLRTRRRDLDLTLQEVASKTGLSTASISQIERGVTAPSLRSLRALCSGLEMSMGDLFSEGRDRTSGESDFVLRAGTRPTINLGSKGVFKELLTPGILPDIQMMIIRVDPGCASGTVPLTIENGQRAGIVTKGTLGLEVDGKTVYLEAGDSFGVAATEGLRFWCASDVRCEVIWVTSPKIY